MISQGDGESSAEERAAMTAKLAAQALAAVSQILSLSEQLALGDDRKAALMAPTVKRVLDRVRDAGSGR